MLSTSEIRNVKFSKAMSGYKQEEVDVLLDTIEADYAQFERLTKEYNAKIDSMSAEVETLKASQNSIQNVLLSAQKLADQIVADAKVKSAGIVSEAESSITAISAKEKELANAFEQKAAERKTALEKELADMVKNAQIKADSIKAATEDSVARQQLLFDKLKMEISAFKTLISEKYKEHFELLKTIPDIVPMDPKKMAELVTAAVDKEPDPESFIKRPVISPELKPAEAAAEEGFRINDALQEPDEN